MIRSPSFKAVIRSPSKPIIQDQSFDASSLALHWTSHQSKSHSTLDLKGRRGNLKGRRGKKEKHSRMRMRGACACKRGRISRGWIPPSLFFPFIKHIDANQVTARKPERAAREILDFLATKLRRNSTPRRSQEESCCRQIRTCSRKWRVATRRAEHEHDVEHADENGIRNRAWISSTLTRERNCNSRSTMSFQTVEPFTSTAHQTMTWEELVDTVWPSWCSNRNHAFVLRYYSFIFNNWKFIDRTWLIGGSFCDAE